jgi:2,3,4,5-tetrahydropyridine-2-carboxylate N-succinyltransferase
MTAITADDLRTEVEAAWAARDSLSTDTRGPVRTAVDETLNMLDAGKLRVAEPAADGAWIVNQWVKEAILLSFRLNPNAVMRGGAAGPFWDKVPTKFDGWDAPQFEAAGFRAVPGCVVRKGAYIARNVILMPSFVNIGAYVDEGTMIDTWATVGSCAQVGKNCHISGGAGLGGVLEPLQANPTIIEDNCFIGARAGSRPNPVDPALPSTYCAVIMKTVDERTRSKTSINELLRD